MSTRATEVAPGGGASRSEVTPPADPVQPAVPETPGVPTAPDTPATPDEPVTPAVPESPVVPTDPDPQREQPIEPPPAPETGRARP